MAERIFFFFFQTLFLDLHVLSLSLSLSNLILFICFHDFQFTVSYFQSIGSRVSQKETISSIVLCFVIALTLATLYLVLKVMAMSLIYVIGDLKYGL